MTLANVGVATQEAHSIQTLDERRGEGQPVTGVASSVHGVVDGYRNFSRYSGM